MIGGDISYNGYWWIPEGVPQLRDTRLSGTLTISSEGTISLELILDPTPGVRFQAYSTIPVMWGEDAGGRLFSLFHLSIIRNENFSKIFLSVNKALLGKFVLSLDQRLFSHCVVRYPFLEDWTFDSRVSVNTLPRDIVQFQLDLHNRESFFSTKIDDSLTLSLSSFLKYHWDVNFNRTIQSIEATQQTHLCLSSDTTLSVSEFLDCIGVLSQFLSFAVLERQTPIVISFEEENGQRHRLFFKVSESKKPLHSRLIDFYVFKKRLPELIQNWIKVYPKLSPIIYAYFHSVFTEGLFEYPSFVVVAEALDGYFKRFLNKRDKKDTRKYKDSMDKIIKHLSDISIIQTCDIDTTVLSATRDKYAHLVPDGELDNAASDYDLLVLTQKCRILLACCILDAIGMDAKEINTCCNNSPLNNILSAYHI